MKPFKGIIEPARHDMIAKQVASNIIKIQYRLADHLNRKTKHWSGKALLFALLLFAATVGGYCLYLILDPFL